MKDVAGYLVSQAFLESLITIIVTVAILVFIKRYLIKKVAYTTKDEQHKNTFIGVIFNLLQYIVVVVAILIVMEVNGVNVTGIVAGLGIMATIVGLALQDTLKDIICGINIYNNNFYKVGDLVKYNGELCDVKYFSARVTKFSSLASGNTYTVCNSTINAMEKVKDSTVIAFVFDFDDDKKKIEKCFLQAYEDIKDDKTLKNFEYFGITDITEKGVKYCAVLQVPGHKSFPLKCKYLDAIYTRFCKAGIEPSRDDERVIRKG